MRFLGNLLWFIFGGLISAIVLFLEGILCCVTIILIPIGLQYFKLARFFLWPMGKSVEKIKPSGLKSVINFFWGITFGLVNFIGYILGGAILCVTIIGIPFGLQYFKVAQFLLLPLGRDFKK